MMLKKIDPNMAAKSRPVLFLFSSENILLAYVLGPFQYASPTSESIIARVKKNTNRVG